MPGKGYGMICYCANPGMLSGVTRGYVPRYDTLRTAGGKEFKGGVFVGTENAGLGMFAHDYFPSLGGIHDGKRLVPCLYVYERQPTLPPAFPPSNSMLSIWAPGYHVSTPCEKGAAPKGFRPSQR